MRQRGKDIVVAKDALPYRPNVGVALFNPDGLVFAGEAIPDGPDAGDPRLRWQMPQGGIDPAEEIVAAARRELREETGIVATSALAVTDEWWPYDFPPYDGPPHRLCMFRGQTQRWVAFRFEGEDASIDIAHPPDGLAAEFSTWAWLPLSELCAIATPHKRPIYRQVLEAFAAFARPKA